MDIEPIVLDQYGAILIPFGERPPNAHPFILGMHQGCTNVNSERVYTQYHSPSHNWIACQGCPLAILVPSNVLPLVATVEVYEPLRQWLAQEILRHLRRERALLKLVTDI